MINNKLIQRLTYVAVIGLLGVAAVTVTTRGTDAKTDLRKLLAGDTSKEWQLKEIKTSAGTMKEEDFDNDENFDMKSDLAQMIPDTVVFTHDGTCETTYVSQYDDGNISDDDYTAACKWSVKGNDVEIIEDVNGDKKMEDSHDEIIVLENVVITGQSFKTGFSLDRLYNGGVEKLVYRTD